MAMHVSTVRFGDDLWKQLEREAGREGVSVAQWVRDAALLRVATLAARRQDDDTLATLAELADRPGRRRARPAAALDAERVAAVRATGLPDGAPHPELDRLTDLARQVLNVPVAMVSLIGDEHQHMVSCPGVAGAEDGTAEIPLSQSICRHVVERRDALVVPDTRQEPLLDDLVPTPGSDVRAYLGAPLITADGHALGSFCAVDEQPRHWTREQTQLLTTLAQAAVTELERARERAAA